MLLYIAGAILPFLNLERDAVLDYIRTFILLVPFLLIYHRKCKKEDGTFSKILLLKYSNIVKYLAFISLIYWLSGSVFHIVSPTFMIPSNWSGELCLIPSYHGLYFETQQANLFNFSIQRNSGIFNEGPMYNMILCTALLIELFVRERVSKWSVFLLVVTILTTFTTTGQIFLLLLLFFSIYKKYKKKRFIILCISPFVILALSFALETLMKDKEENAHASYNARKADIEACIRVGVENPILGVSLYHQRKGINDDYGFSNSLFTIFAHGGVYTLLLYIGALLFIPWRAYTRREYRGISLMLLFYFFLFTITISNYRYLTFFMISYSLCLMSYKKHSFLKNIG